MNLKKTCQYLLLAGGICTQTNVLSQEISDVKETSQKNIYTVMDSVNYQNQDSTTNQIFKILSGFDKDTLLYPEIAQDQDSAMYKTLWAMNAKYNNPKVKFMEDRAYSDDRVDAYYDGGNIICFKKNTKTRYGERNQIILFLAELAHAYQSKRDGFSLFQEKFAKDYLLIMEQGKKYEDLYPMLGTIENEAHHIIEPKLNKEFIDTYASLCDTNDVKCLYKIFAFNAGFFERYDNKKEAQKYFEKILAIDGEIKNEWLGKHALWSWFGHGFEDQRDTTKNEKYYELAKICYLNSIKSGINDYNYLSRFCVKKGDIGNAIKYNQLYFRRHGDGASENVAEFCIKCGKYQEAIQIYKNLVKKGNKYAMSCLINLYDPESRDDDGKPYPCSDKAKKDFREKKYIEIYGIR